MREDRTKGQEDRETSIDAHDHDQKERQTSLGMASTKTILLGGDTLRTRCAHL